MKTVGRWRTTVPTLFAGILLGFGLALSGPLLGQVAPPARKAPPVPPQTKAQEEGKPPGPLRDESPRHRSLDANLYMETSAEYRAACHQAFHLALSRLKAKCEASKGDGKKLAVILDLDETVLDNAGFQAMLLRSGWAYDQRLWDVWEEKHADHVALIPGAKEFIDQAGKLPVTLVYISNRNEKFRAHTLDALTRLGIVVSDPKQLKLATTTSNKTDRRNAVAAEYTVVLNIGDNLRDFDEAFKSKADASKPGTDVPQLVAAIKDRKATVDRLQAHFGDDWVILPNAAYGEWTRPLGLGMADYDRLVPAVPQ